MEMETTLEESLLDDLDDLSDVEEEEEAEAVVNEEGGGGKADNTTNDGKAFEDKADGMCSQGKEDEGMEESSVVVDASTCRLLEDPKLQSHMDTVRRFLSSSGNDENDDDDDDDDDDALALITSSNRHLRSIQSEILRSHTQLTSAYAARFPELEELLPDPVRYKEAVKVIQNHTDMTLINERLNTEARLTPNQIITLSVAGSTTSGSPLNTPALRHVNALISRIDTVLTLQSLLLRFLTAQMEQILPNTCSIIGPTVAARLLSHVGGIAELSRVPACNLQLLGQVRATAASRGGMGTSLAQAVAQEGASSSALRSMMGGSGGSGNSSHQQPSSFAPTGTGGGGGGNSSFRPHEGIIAECDLLRRVPVRLRRRALKVVAAKTALAIRCDYVNVETGRSRTEDTGLALRREIEEKFVKWEDPDKAPLVKALPKPDLTTKKRRGGRRMRRLKERFEQTEMMKQANRRGFSVETGEYGDDAMGLTLGMLEKQRDGSSNSGGTAAGVGSLRRQYARASGGESAGPGEKRKMRQANTKASRKKAKEMGMGGGRSVGGQQTSGAASSMVFTPVQGMELVNPDAMKDKVRDANRKWFAENSGFMSALPKNK